MKGEEVTLFSLIKSLNAAISSGQAAPRNSFGPLSNAVQFMNEDDDFENKLLGILAELSDGFARPPEAPSRYRALVIRLQALTLDLHEDIHKEDDLLFLEEIRLEADCVLAGKEKTP